MKELKVCRRQEGKFTVAASYPDYGAFAHDGLFPDIKYTLRIDTEEELIRELNRELHDDAYTELFASDIDYIYYGNEDVTEKYLEFINGEGYRLLECWRS